ncbi:MAG: hypothetical protein ACJA0X_003282 [Cyclobacteriaceae bacterium]|jgi:hypothetical protein
MKILNLTILIVFIFQTQESFSQTDYREGFIVLNSGDTITGLIEYKGVRASARVCRFRETITGESKNYRPEDLSAYRVTDGKYYVTKNLPETNETIFLEYLVNGVLDVFFYYDDGDNYLIETEEGELMTLEDEAKEIYDNGRFYASSSKGYIGTLKIIFSKDFEFANKIDNINLDHKSLIKVSKEYHYRVCDENQACIIYEKEVAKIERSFGILLGKSFLAFRSQGAYNEGNLPIASFDINTTPSLGVYFKANMPFLNEKLGYTIESSYFRTKILARSTSEEFLVTLREEERLINHTLANNLSFTYDIKRNEDMKFFIMGGMFFNYFFISDYYWLFESKENATGDVLGLSEIDDNYFLPYDGGISLGLGAEHRSLFDRNFTLMLRYQVGQGYRDLLSTNYLSFVLGMAL